MDALLLQIGINDVGFGKVTHDCAYPTVTVPDAAVLAALVSALAPDVVALPVIAALVALAAVRDQGDLLTVFCTDAPEFFEGLAALDSPGNNRYVDLNNAIAHGVSNGPRPFTIRPGGIYMAPYPNPLHGPDGSLCNEIRLQGAVEDNVSVPTVAEYAGLIGTVVDTVTGNIVKGAIETGALDLLMGSDGIISSDEIRWLEPNIMFPLNDRIRPSSPAWAGLT